MNLRKNGKSCIITNVMNPGHQFIVRFIELLTLDDLNWSSKDLFVVTTLQWAALVVHATAISWLFEWTRYCA